MAVPVVLLTGYLGAGKTTLLNHLLSSDAVRERAPALIINEFGTLGVDGHLVPPDAPRYEINQGSLFCTCTKAQLVQALGQIAAAGRAGLVLIESTGIAETRNLEGDLALPELTRGFRIQATLCLVDAANFLTVAAFLQTVPQQVRWADGLVINKTDGVPEAELDRLAEVLRELNPRAPQIRVTYGRVPEEFWLHLRHTPPAELPAERPPPEIVAVSVQSELAVDRRGFADAVQRLGPRLLRLKGNVLFTDGPKRFVEVVSGEIREREASASMGAGTAFSAIGWRVSRTELAAVWERLVRSDS
jgi:G3E family GTPase